MDRRPLGRTGLEVGALSLGGVFLSSAATPRDSARDAVRAAVAHGINFFDTAPDYGDSEEALGAALSPIDAPVVVATKLGGHPKPFDPRDRALLRASAEASLRRLRRDVIDVMFVHEADRVSPYDWWHDRATPRGPVLDVLDELRDRGVVRWCGVSGTTAYAIADLVATGRFDVVLTAFQYNLLFREAEHELLPAAAATDTAVVIGSPLGQGIFLQPWAALLSRDRRMPRPRRQQLEALARLVDDVGISLPELALRFPLRNAQIATVLSGARSASEVEANVAAVERGALSDEVMRRLDEIHAMVPFRPYGESAADPFGAGVWS